MRKSTLNGILSFLLSVVLAGGVCACGYASRDNNGKWFANKNLSTWHWSDNATDNSDDKDNNTSEDFTGAVVDCADGNGINLLSSVLPRSAYSENGISETADSAYTLTAVVTPENANDKRIAWSAAFADSSSEWAKNRSVTDYVTVEPSTAYSSTAIVTCLQDFGEQIIVTARSVDNSNAYANCTVDFVKPLISFTAVLNTNINSEYLGRLYVDGRENEITIMPEYGVGTVVGDYAEIQSIFTFTKSTYDNILKTMDNCSIAGVTGRMAKESFAISGLNFICPVSLMQNGNGNSSGAETVLNNYFFEHGWGDGTSGSSVAQIGSWEVSLNYVYGDRVCSTLECSGGAFNVRKDGLIKINSVTDVGMSDGGIIFD